MTKHLNMRDIRYEPIVTLGNLISLMSLMVSLAVFVVYNERRMSQHEGTFSMHAYRIQQLEMKVQTVILPPTTATFVDKAKGTK